MAALATSLRTRFSPVAVILSPPRCGSTALARSFWRHPDFRWYAHEPHDRMYHRGADTASVLDAIDGAIDSGRTTARGLIIKEMTFQAGPNLGPLMRCATVPVMITVRDPRLSIWSRMRKREQNGYDPAFPAAESGWPDLQAALALARSQDVPHVVVEFTHLREYPATVLPALCDRLGIRYCTDMLSWPARDDLDLGRLGAEQRNWYHKVLSSTGFQAETAGPPPLGSFPATMRADVARCVESYLELLDSPGTVRLEHS